MKQDKKFDEILNVCLERLLRGESVEQCLLDYPQEAKELEPLLKTALVARAASALRPSSEFKARARYEFQAAVREKQAAGRQFVEKRAVPSFRWRWQSAWSLAVIALVVVLISGTSTVFAARNTMPDSPLYSVKIFSENVRLSLTRSDVAKAELNAGYANSRAEEIVYAAARGNVEEVRSTTQLLSSNMVNITGLSSNTLAGNSVQNNNKNIRNDLAAGQKNVSNSAEQAAAPNTAPQNAVPPAVAPLAAVPPATTEAGGFSMAAPAPPAPATAAAPVVATDAVPVPAAIPAAGAVAPAGAEPRAAAKGVLPDETTQTAEDTAGPEADGTAGPQINVMSANNRLGTNAGGGKETDLQKLRRIIDENYTVLISRLEEALKVASPDARPIIRQTLAQAQAEYQKAINNLDLAETNAP